MVVSWLLAVDLENQSAATKCCCPRDIISRGSSTIAYCLFLLFILTVRSAEGGLVFRI